MGRAFVGGPGRAFLGLIGPGLWAGPGFKHPSPSPARPMTGRAIPKPIAGRAGLFSNGPGGPPSAHGPSGQMMRPTPDYILLKYFDLTDVCLFVNYN